MRLRDRLTKFENLPDDLELVSGSTSIEADAARTLKWSDVKPIYDKGACLVPWHREKDGFDGNSHPSLGYWIKNNENIDPKPGSGWQRTALGFAIQRDNAGYYVRFASGYNQGPGSQISDQKKNTVFAPRSATGQAKKLDETRELRDLPKEWAQVLVAILARDLHQGYFTPEPGEKFFDRITSRNEHETTKLKRLTRLT
jgi:hypothetical protein